jgi:hypothetical protein
MIARWKGDENTRRKADVKPEGKAPRNWWLKLFTRWVQALESVEMVNNG